MPVEALTEKKSTLIKVSMHPRLLQKTKHLHLNSRGPNFRTAVLRKFKVRANYKVREFT